MTDPPEVEDPPELCVSCVQEEVGLGWPVLVDGRHGGHGAVQAQEVLLHLQTQRKLCTMDSQ